MTMEPQKNKVPKRVIHCSDGTVEEFSSEDERDSPKSQDGLPVVNPKTLSWFPWMWYQTTWVGSKTLSACDYVGESLASFFGITDSKYQFEIREYDRMKAREAELQKKEDLEMGGWREENRNNLVDQNTSPEQLNTSETSWVIFIYILETASIPQTNLPKDCRE
ncbi:protein FAM177A1-like isoform X2 [Athalia rosae]|uniref:protein FAM177A1-like isoform X2 n=1 Tax=Athalia rosae TaxID=37344 RepID=UPI00203400CB|nr:protein FAM177A1-like isoform X2 [Athalia rosae]